MEWLNYHHLLDFWLVAKEGRIARASQQLRLAHPTISGQIRRLELASTGQRPGARRKPRCKQEFELGRLRQLARSRSERGSLAPGGRCRRPFVLSLQPASIAPQVVSMRSGK